MGHTPIPPYRSPTRLEAAKRSYVKGRISLEEFEERVEELIRTGTENDSEGATPPPPDPRLVKTIGIGI